MKADEIVAELKSRFPDARLEQKQLPSGVVWIDLWRGEQFVTIECSPTLGYGVSLVKEDDPGFDGHDWASLNAAEVIPHVHFLLQGR